MQNYFNGYTSACSSSSAPDSSEHAHAKRMWIDEDVDMEDVTMPSPSKARSNSSLPYGQELVYERTKIMMMEGQRRMQQESLQQKQQQAMQRQLQQQQDQFRANTPLYTGKGKGTGPINAFQLMFQKQRSAATAQQPEHMAGSTLHQQHQTIFGAPQVQKQYPSGHECPKNCIVTLQQQLPGIAPPAKCTFCERPQCLECSLQCRSCKETFCGACSTSM
ncbi:hypothetical protein BGW42_005938 [Actinomortierella wolfii]|nr:hypothetical protein BGW42_005938 [Actinomortierella wolfii]